MKGSLYLLCSILVAVSATHWLNKRQFSEECMECRRIIDPVMVVMREPSFDELVDSESGNIRLDCSNAGLTEGNECIDDMNECFGIPGNDLMKLWTYFCTEKDGPLNMYSGQNSLTACSFEDQREETLKTFLMSLGTPTFD